MDERGPEIFAWVMTALVCVAIVMLAVFGLIKLGEYLF